MTQPTQKGSQDIRERDERCLELGDRESVKAKREGIFRIMATSWNEIAVMLE